MNALIDQELAEWAIAHRRYLHENPELSGQEYETCQYIRNILQQLDLEILDYPAPSVVALLKGTEGAKTIALRADIDALPITEESDKSYVSKRPGVMHACGHDGHTAILLAVAKWMSEHRSEIKHNVQFIFQSSEEMLPSGAEKLVKEGVVDHVDAVFGLHLWQAMEKGKIGVAHGPMMASADDFRITIEGKGGHGSMPHDTVDPIYIAGHIITALQSIIGRRINPLQPAVISVGKVETGTTYNIIPSQAFMCGTVRAFSNEMRDFLNQEMKKLVEGISASFGAVGRFEFDYGTPAVVNDKEMSQFAEQVIADTFGADTVAFVEPVMGGEDFSHYLQRQRGAFIFVGMGGEKSAYPHHHQRFDIDEETIPDGIALFIQLVKQFA
ncbi:M20 metallopeptidase family protein [Brevibacillus fulvus]|uniref:Amidohydrolase n=1 Tax=Brevibacillus fulvus TaxID=1125967 RepID=A0A938XZN5_9BACL|nr:amidohydrolase [Brevibacillus fulvus]MBM7590696.1 amidohydrolase [Brevibacillus fulvus]